jgi:hypothetical protein
MTYRVIKVIKGISYLYEQESYREGGKVKTRCRCLGRVDAAGTVNTTSDSAPLNTDAIRDGINSKAFAHFLSGTVPGYFPVAIASDYIAEILSAASKMVLLSQATILSHSGVHPEVTPERYTFLQTLIDRGEVVRDRARHVIVYGQDNDWWVAILKGTIKGEIFLQSYHRSNPDHVRRIKKRGSMPL